jgi:hypothetical protein
LISRGTAVAFRVADKTPSDCDEVGVTTQSLPGELREVSTVE